MGNSIAAQGDKLLRSSLQPPLNGRHATLSDALKAAAEQFGEREAYVEGAQRLSFAAWRQAADCLAMALTRLGVRKGEVVALVLESSIDFAICCMAISRLGAVISPINPRLGNREVDAILKSCLPVVILTEDEIQLPAGADAAIVVKRYEFSTWFSELGEVERTTVDERDAAVIVWTSGTTGLPKGAWFDHNGLRAAIVTAGVLARPFDRRLVPTPFAHSGYMAKLWEQLAFGITVVITPMPWKAQDMVRLIAEERIDVAYAVPTQWAKFVEVPDLVTADLSSLRLCVTASAPAPAELVAAVNSITGAPMIARYAMTESPSVTGTRPSDAASVLHRTVGLPQQGVELLVGDELGMPVAVGEVGQIRVRSEHMMRGYWGDPERSFAALTRDGWLISSDRGYLDNQGNLVLTGRSSDMYIRGGYNIYPIEAENVLLEHPEVLQCAVVGVPAPVIGEIGVAYVVAVHCRQADLGDQLRDWCKQRLTNYKVPDRIEFLDHLPLTVMMKIDKAALRAMALGGTQG